MRKTGETSTGMPLCISDFRLDHVHHIEHVLVLLDFHKNTEVYNASDLSHDLITDSVFA